MASGYSSVVVVGNLTRDPETRQTTNNTITTGTIAVSQKYGQQERTHFIDWQMWGKGGETLAKYAGKGTKILLAGELQQDSWKDKDGNNRSKILVNARDFTFLGSKKGGDQMVDEKLAGTGVASDDIPF